VLKFNVSHSANMAVIAVGSEHRRGVDIERICGDIDTASLAERFFSLRKRARLQALPDHLRVPGFFACWTRKEAILKATGDGLSFPLADFSVTTHPDLNPELEGIRGNTEAHKQWFPGRHQCRRWLPRDGGRGGRFFSSGNLYSDMHVLISVCAPPHREAGFHAAFCLHGSPSGFCAKRNHSCRATGIRSCGTMNR
jgi:phosphopantetheinyl transferase (holo-ACP synthase)